MCILFRKESRVKDALSGLKQFLANESPLKMIKNAYYFTLKALFVLEIFTFLSSLFGHVKNALIRKTKIIWTKSQNKNLIILRTKRAFKIDIFHHFKGLALKQIKQFFLEGEIQNDIWYLSNTLPKWWW